MAAARPLDLSPSELIPISPAAGGEEPSTCQKITHLFWKTINGFITVLQMLTQPLYALFDEGLANLLGLEILRHGTSLHNYVSIMTDGANPNFGGSEVGSSMGHSGFDKDHHYVKSSKDYFHVFKDSDARVQAETVIEEGPSGKRSRKCGPEGCEGVINCMGPLIAQTAVRAMPMYHAALSGYASANSDSSDRSCAAKTMRIAGSVLGFFTPTLRFKFTPERVKQVFENDPDYDNLAFRTRLKIGPEHIGITGSLAQGLNCGLFHRIGQNPGKFLLGLIQLILAVALVALIATSVLFLLA